MIGVEAASAAGELTRKRLPAAATAYRYVIIRAEPPKDPGLKQLPWSDGRPERRSTAEYERLAEDPSQPCNPIVDATAQ